MYVLRVYYLLACPWLDSLRVPWYALPPCCCTVHLVQWRFLRLRVPIAAATGCWVRYGAAFVYVCAASLVMKSAGAGREEVWSGCAAWRRICHKPLT